MENYNIKVTRWIEALVRVFDGAVFGIFDMVK